MSKFNPQTDIPSLTGKVAIVTGGNRGIGYHITLELARHGATVYLAARSESAAKDAIRQMDEELEAAARGRVKFLHLDLSTIKGAKSSAEHFLTLEGQLDILVHNAAVLGHNYGLNSEGIEDTMATNHLAPFAFTQVVLPLLEKTSKSADVRVVALSSYMYKKAPKGGKLLTVEEINDALGPPASINTLSSMQLRYSRSKLANLLFTRHLQEHFKSIGSTALAISVNPGDVATESVLDFVRPLPLIGGLAAWALKAYMFTPAQGAYTALFAATSPTVRENVDTYGGSYLIPFGKVETFVGDGANDELVTQFWDASARIVDGVLSS
ncbi:NAD(P)-binding protein [Exidia glandulosa HHB12029]|uniref:NAD(P)-binding protein n=1 Tax=Exidia glandulosa HHB12029 TaxID=1314781 RepID=A0A165BPC8_EXIGL|nr:NAD(P)-binding protein [Exidia glandulosa HHB12029]